MDEHVRERYRHFYKEGIVPVISKVSSKNFRSSADAFLDFLSIVPEMAQRTAQDINRRKTMIAFMTTATGGKPLAGAGTYYNRLAEKELFFDETKARSWCLEKMEEGFRCVEIIPLQRVPHLTVGSGGGSGGYDKDLCSGGPGGFVDETEL